MSRCHLIHGAPIACLTGCLDSFMALGQHTIYRNKVEYCKAHGYHLEIIRSIRPKYADPLSHAGGFSWSRLEHLLDMVESGLHQWIWTCGADVLITNMAIRLEDIIADSQTTAAQYVELPTCPEFPGYGIPEGLETWPRNGVRHGKKHVIITGECVTSLQADSFLVRCSKEGADWVRDILDCWPRYRHHPWAEQMAMMDRIEKHAPILHIVPQHVLNSYRYEHWHSRGERYKTGLDCYGWRGQWEPGDFLIHLAGMDMETRLRVLPEYYAK